MFTVMSEESKEELLKIFLTRKLKYSELIKAMKDDNLTYLVQRKNDLARYKTELDQMNTVWHKYKRLQRVLLDSFVYWEWQLPLDIQADFEPAKTARRLHLGFFGYKVFDITFELLDIEMEKVQEKIRSCQRDMTAISKMLGLPH